MTAVVSALVVLALFLAAWSALSLVSLPLLVAVRSHARASARLTRGLERRALARRR